MVTAIAAVFVLTPRRPGARDVLLLFVFACAAVVPVAVLALVLSVLTSVQGVATGAVVLPLVGVAVLGSWLRADQHSPG
jgi:hypothetical protein